MKISARRAPSSKESDSSCTSRHTPHARAPARDAGARDHGADGDGMCASRSRRGVHPRSIRSRVEDRRRRARHGGTRSPTGPRAWRVRRLHHHLRRERTGQSLGDVRARRAHQPRSSPPREPAVSGRRATPPAIRTAAPVPRRRLRRSVVHGDRRRRRRPTPTPREDAPPSPPRTSPSRAPPRQPDRPTFEPREDASRPRVGFERSTPRWTRADVDSRPTADAPTGETKPACRGSSPSTASSPRPSSRRDDGGARGRRGRVAVAREA